MWTWMKAAMSSIGSFLLPFIKIFLSSIGPALATAAMTAVSATAENMKDGSSKDKRDAAYTLIVDQLKIQGITAAESMINCAIEAAVAKLKEK